MFPIFLNQVVGFWLAEGSKAAKLKKPKDGWCLVFADVSINSVAASELMPSTNKC